MVILNKKAKEESDSVSVNKTETEVVNKPVYDLTAGFKRILIVSHNHPNHVQGGAEACAYDMFKEIRAREIADAVFIAGDHPSDINNDLEREAKIRPADLIGKEYILPNTNFSFFTQVRKNSSAIYNAFADFLLEFNPEVIHFHHTLKIGLEALKIARATLPEAKIIYTLHDFIPICHREGQMVKTDGNLCDVATPEACNRCFPAISPQQFKMRELFVKTHLDLVDSFVAPSQFLAKRYISWGLPANMIHVIPNGRTWQEKAEQRQIKSGEKRNRFAFFGNITPYKGVDVLLEAVKILRDSGNTDFSVSIHGGFALGNDEKSAILNEKIKSLEPQIRFFDKYPNNELAERIRHTDYVIVPSTWWENAPLVIDEALHHGRPVICSGIGGMAEKIKDGENGLHFRRGDANHLASVMLHAMQDKNVWERLFKNTGEQISMEYCLHEHLKLYRNVHKA